jgi:peptidyl-prolyl cis-trans isomerase D
MLLEIREKVQGVFASIILVFVCVLFGLWGIQNYLGGGKEAPVVSVGDKEFFQRDVTQAYQQFEQSLAGMKFDEEMVKKQALDKLIRDEVLLQHAQEQDLSISDETARAFIQSLEYFQKDGKFDKGQYQAMLSSQGMSSDGFVAKIKKALMMEQFQRAVVDSGFVTKAEVDGFFKIQNQKRDVEYVTIPLANVAQQQVSEEDITSYYQQHLDAFKTEEQASIQYVELSLDKLAGEVKASEEQLKAYYEEQKSLYTTKERRKISHILFAFDKKQTDAEQQALQKATKARQDLKAKDFAALAAEVSDDKLTAKTGGDLGLFEVGVMEKDFETAVSQLKLGEVSEPVKSSFGYHLIKVTELVPGEVKSYDAVKPELTKAYQKAQAEGTFNQLGEKLGEVSYENPDSLDAAAKLLGVTVSKTGLFGRDAGDGVAGNEKVRTAAFSEDVLKGSNSEPIEVGSDKLVVLRMESYVPASVKELKAVHDQVVAALKKSKADQQASEQAAKIKQALLSGSTLAQAAEANKLVVKKVNALTRTTTDVSPAILQAVFKAPKPQANRPSVVVIDEPTGGKIVANIGKVSDGEMTEADKGKQAAIDKNIAAAFGKAQFEALLNQLQAEADINIRAPKQ